MGGRVYCDRGVAMHAVVSFCIELGYIYWVTRLDLLYLQGMLFLMGFLGSVFSGSVPVPVR